MAWSLSHLNEITSKVRKNSPHQRIGREEYRLYVVLPFLTSLGYSIHNLDEVILKAKMNKIIVNVSEDIELTISMDSTSIPNNYIKNNSSLYLLIDIDKSIFTLYTHAFGVWEEVVKIPITKYEDEEVKQNYITMMEYIVKEAILTEYDEKGGRVFTEIALNNMLESGNFNNRFVQEILRQEILNPSDDFLTLIIGRLRQQFSTFSDDLMFEQLAPLKEEGIENIVMSALNLKSKDSNLVEEPKKETKPLLDSYDNEELEHTEEEEEETFTDDTEEVELLTDSGETEQTEIGGIFNEEEFEQFDDEDEIEDVEPFFDDEDVDEELLDLFNTVKDLGIEVEFSPNHTVEYYQELIEQHEKESNVEVIEEVIEEEPEIIEEEEEEEIIEEVIEEVEVIEQEPEIEEEPEIIEEEIEEEPEIEVEQEEPKSLSLEDIEMEFEEKEDEEESLSLEDMLSQVGNESTESDDSNSMSLDDMLSSVDIDKEDEKPSNSGLDLNDLMSQYGNDEEKENKKGNFNPVFDLLDVDESKVKDEKPTTSNKISFDLNKLNQNLKKKSEEETKKEEQEKEQTMKQEQERIQEELKRKAELNRKKEERETKQKNDEQEELKRLEEQRRKEIEEQRKLMEEQRKKEQEQLTSNEVEEEIIEEVVTDPSLLKFNQDSDDDFSYDEYGRLIYNDDDDTPSEQSFVEFDVGEVTVNDVDSNIQDKEEVKVKSIDEEDVLEDYLYKRKRPTFD